MENQQSEAEQPPSSLFTRTVNYLYERFGTRLLKNKKELITIFDEAQESGLMDEEARDTMQRVLQVSDLQVRDITIPSAQMVVVENDMTLDATLDVMVESAHSRFPVMNTERDKVVGILLAKEMLRFFDREDDESFDLSELLREPVFVPESKRVNVLLAEFRQERNHMAIVIDEYGAVSGLVTIEDVLEQIVGEIDDEYDFEDDEQSMIRKSSTEGYVIKAVLHIDEFNEYFKTNLQHERADTMGGLLSQKLGRVPAVGDTMEIGDVRFEVINADSRRVHLVRVFQQH
ncbi:MAG: HlyC/CorC family transporter [Arenicella sp.]